MPICFWFGMWVNDIKDFIRLGCFKNNEEATGLGKYFEKELGASTKDVRTKLRKIDPLPPCLQNVRIDPTPHCPCRHTINFEKFGVFAPKSADVRIWEPPCPQNVRTRQTLSPRLRTYFMDSPLSFVGGTFSVSSLSALEK